MVLISGSRNFLDFDRGSYLLRVPTRSETGSASVWAKCPGVARKQSRLLSRKPCPLLLSSARKAVAGTPSYWRSGIFQIASKALLLWNSEYLAIRTGVIVSLSDICPALPSSACGHVSEDASQLLIRAFGIQKLNERKVSFHSFTADREAIRPRQQDKIFMRVFYSIDKV